VKKINYFYTKFIISLILRPLDFTLFLLFDDVKGGESVCLCFVLKLFQVIQLQNKGGDIQDRGSFIEQTLSKGYGLSSSKRGEIVKKISFLDLAGF
jgi:hypothetical protein